MQKFFDNSNQFLIRDLLVTVLHRKGDPPFSPLSVQADRASWSMYIQRIKKRDRIARDVHDQVEIPPCNPLIHSTLPSDPKNVNECLTSIIWAGNLSNFKRGWFNKIS